MFKSIITFLAIVVLSYALKIASPLKRHVGPPFKLSYLKNSKKAPENLEDVTKKYGLEIGLWKSIQNSQDGQLKPQDLLKKFGIAYLATSISLAIISYAICYSLVSAGVDVTALLAKVGIQANAATTNAGTAAVAYAVHKAASPIRFPPTVALTPVVARLIGKEVEDVSETKSSEEKA